MEAGRLQIGRDSERRRVTAVVDDATAGRPGALLVAGEPGIGKTSLVAEVTSGPAAADHLVLWGRCLRFGADSSSYLPIGQLLTQWHRQADPAERARVLSGAEHVATLAPALAAVPGSPDSTRVLPLVAAVLDRMAQRTPVTLVVDDVQWADGSSLDLLAYLMAGFDAGQRWCLLLTYRDTELGEGHRLHGWLADVLRLPAVGRLRLERLGHTDAEELTSRLLAAVGSEQDVGDVVARSGGNPYYTEMLVRAAGAGDADRPGEDGLRQELLGSWHRLDREARELLQLLALGGRPVTTGLLEELTAARGGRPGTVHRSLAEASTAGLTAVSSDGQAWFHHPLVAEVVAQTLDAGARARVHRDYVEVLEAVTGVEIPARAAHLALHHDGAGNGDQAFLWSLQAAREAAVVRGHAEESDHLHRACRLWDVVGTQARAAAGGRTALWVHASDRAWSAGEHDLAIRLREQADDHDEPDDPRLAVRLRLTLLEWWRASGRPGAARSVGASRAVLELAEARCPGTAEHAMALAQLAHAEVWSEDPAATRHAAAAVRMARSSGSTEALAWALSIRSETPPWDVTLEHATRSLALAREVGDPRLLGWAATRAANRLDRMGRAGEETDVLLATFRQLVAQGSVHDAMYAAPARAAALLLDLGRWSEAAEVLRLLLSHRLTVESSALARGVAAVLALRSGDEVAGREHLRRSQELQPWSPHAGDLLLFLQVEAEAELGHHREVLSMAARMMPAQLILDPTAGDELLLVAARAAGDLAEQPGSRDEAVGLLEEVVGLRGRLPLPFEAVEPGDVVHAARGSLFAADRARCHADHRPAPLWREAVEACQAAGMAWHEARASHQLARALLHQRGSRGDATAALRRAVDLAGRLGARPVLEDCLDLARQGHVPLDHPEAAAAPAAPDGGALASLTQREQEVLVHLLAGRTYAEIAQELFISKKTVSVHVSNLLRKTGASSRVELARLVRHSATPE